MSEVRQRAIFDSAVGVAIIATDVDGRITDWNAGAERILGWSRDEMKGQTAERFFTPEDRTAGRLETEMRTALTEGSANDERWHLRKDDTRFWASGEMMPMRAEDGEHLGFLKVLRDRTEGHLAGEALRQAQSRLRSAQAAGGVGFFSIDTDDDVLHATPEFCRLFGMPMRERFPALDVEQLIVPEDVGLMSSARRGSGEMKMDVEYRIRRPSDGAIRWIARQAEIERDAEGRPLRFAGVVRDVTDSKAAERRQKAVARFADRRRDVTDPEEIAVIASAMLGEALGVGLVGYGVVDPAEETISVHRDWTAPGVGSLAGISRFRDYGNYIEDLKAGRTVVVEDAYVDARTAGGADALVAKNARAFVNLPVFERGRFVALLYVSQGAPRHWDQEDLAFIREVADRTRGAVERARAEEERAAQAVELARLNGMLKQLLVDRTRERDRIWASTSDLMGTAGLDGFLKAVNPAWTRMLGWSEPELLAKPFIDLIEPGDHAETADVVRRLAAGEVVTDFVDHLFCQNGETRTIMWDAVPDGETFYIVGRDITALRKAEEQLRQSQKMEAVGQLTGGIAHDFNNLLTGITGSLDLMTTRIAQGRINDLERYATAAQGAAKRAAALTHRLLAFSRRQTLDPKATDVNRLIKGMEDLIRRTVGPAVQIEVVAAVGLWPTLIDPPQLENALLNLCINARDAMPEGGRITIETANRWLDRRAAAERDLEAGQYLSLCVSDTGTGMPPDVIAKAFDPFFTTKPIGQGTGLGLSMIYGFVRQSGGQVRIYSEVGGGTNVCLYLPRHLGAEDIGESVRELADAPRAGQGETVLVVDDEPTVRMLVTEVLEELGYAAIEAADGPSGLRILQSDVPIDLLVSDVGLPGGMNGRQMADAARIRRPGLKILFITGYAENAVVGNGHLDPGMHVMTKPFAMEALAARIKDLIAGV